MKVFNAQIAKTGTNAKTGNDWTLVSFKDEKGQKYSSFDAFLLDVQDGTDVPGKVTVDDKGNGVVYHNFKAAKNSELDAAGIQLKSPQNTPQQPLRGPDTNTYALSQRHPQTSSDKSQPDWDAIAEGKVRHGLVVAMIQAGWDYPRITRELGPYTHLVMHGEPLMTAPQEEVPF